jgi:hypothetical protein
VSSARAIKKFNAGGLRRVRRITPGVSETLAPRGLPCLIQIRRSARPFLKKFPRGAQLERHPGRPRARGVPRRISAPAGRCRTSEGSASPHPDIAAGEGRGASTSCLGGYASARHREIPKGNITTIVRCPALGRT